MPAMFPRKLSSALIAAWLLCLAATAATYGADPGPPTGRPLIIGFSRNILHNVDPRDAIGLAKVWVQTAERDIKNGLPSTVAFYQTGEELEKALENNKVDIVALIAEDYVHLRERVHILPALSSDYGNNFYDDLLLVVRKDSGINKVEQLRGKSIKIEAGQRGSLPVRWLDSYLRKSCSTNSRKFFAAISQSPKASQVVMPLFFGQADSCIASRDSLVTMAELNPQIGKSLRILATSPGFATGIIAVRRGAANPQTDAMVKAMRDMHKYPKGKTLLTLFRINRLVEFKAEHLKTIEKLMTETSGKAVGASSRRGFGEQQKILR